MGLKTEQEHNKDPKTDVVNTKNDLLKIVLAHMKEDPKYYTNLAKMETGISDAYAPAEYPQMRDPYRQGGFSPATHISTNGIPNDSTLRRTSKVKHKPINPDDEDDRPRLKEMNGSINTLRIIGREFVKRNKK
jgi:hypothetical protein